MKIVQDRVSSTLGVFLLLLVRLHSVRLLALCDVEAKKLL